MSTLHKNLTGADLHEPKGIEIASSDQVYVANGSGSGVWKDLSSLYPPAVVPVASLDPSASIGDRSFVNDANATTFGSVVAGGGANKVPVYYDGAWKIG